MTQQQQQCLRLLRDAAKREDDWCRVPERGMTALENYVIHRIEPGRFLFAVLTNDLLGAVSSADDTNLRLLPQWTRLVDNYVPSICWGSHDRVERWLSATADTLPVYSLREDDE